MKKIIEILLFSGLVFNISCKGNNEKEMLLQSEIDRLNQELENEKFGAENIMKDARKFFENKDYVNAKNKINLLNANHPTDPLISEANKMLIIINEELLWQDAKVKNDLDLVNKYLNNYPEGKYKINANNKIQEFEILKKENDYNEAVKSNTSYTWKNFLENYPNHPEKSKIEKRIIELEVDEILSDRNTGKMPSFDRDIYSTSSTSNVTVKNNTGCELTVRYSGKKVTKVEILNGESSLVNLPSGEYRVAASACNSNYGATELLTGDYSSTFYIERYYR